MSTSTKFTSSFFAPISNSQQILVWVSVLVFFTAAIVVTVQKFFVFGSNTDYQLSKSLLYNLLVFVPFSIWILSGIELQKRIKGGVSFRYLLKTIVITLIVFLSYPSIINLLLFGISFTSQIFSKSFFIKYFTGVIQVHLSVLFLVQLILYVNKKRSFEAKSSIKGTQSVKEMATSLWFESFDHYVKIHTDEKTSVERITLNKLEKELPEKFIRIHRKYIVNFEMVEQIYIKERVMYVDIKGERLRVSRSNEKKVKELYNSRHKLSIRDK